MYILITSYNANPAASMPVYMSTIYVRVSTDLKHVSFRAHGPKTGSTNSELCFLMSSS